MVTTPSKPSSSSILFDPQCRANERGLIAAIEVVQNELQERERTAWKRSRSRTLAATKRFALAVEALCCNLIITRLVGGGAALAVPLDHNALWGNGRYANAVYGQHFLDVVRLLEELGLWERLATGYRFSVKAKMPSLYRATDAFFARLTKEAMQWQAIRREADPELIVLKGDKDEDGKSSPVAYEDTKRTRQWRSQVRRINDWLASADLILLPQPTAGSEVGGDGQSIAIWRRSLHRTFNNGSWHEGGRLWGGFWMSMKRSERFERIRIDGERIADVDYQQLFPRLAYARAQAEPPLDDFYNIAGDGSSRSGWKILINAMLFAEKPLGNWPKGSRRHFPEGMSLRDAVELIERKHPAIVPLFGAGLGYQLMWMESDILISAVTNLFRMGITALPLHDAVLVQRAASETAREVLEHELELRTGYRRATVSVDFCSS